MRNSATSLSIITSSGLWLDLFQRYWNSFCTASCISSNFARSFSLSLSKPPRGRLPKSTMPASDAAAMSAWSRPKICRKKVGAGFPFCWLRRTVTCTALVKGPPATNWRLPSYQVPNTMSSSFRTEPFSAAGMFFSAYSSALATAFFSFGSWLAAASAAASAVAAIWLWRALCWPRSMARAAKPRITVRHRPTSGMTLPRWSRLSRPQRACRARMSPPAPRLFLEHVELGRQVAVHAEPHHVDPGDVGLRHRDDDAHVMIGRMGQRGRGLEPRRHVRQLGHGVRLGIGFVGDIADREPARRIAGRVGHAVLDQKQRAVLDDAEQQREQQRRDQRELHRARAALVLPKSIESESVAHRMPAAALDRIRRHER